MPQLHYYKLPHDVSKTHVLLLDATVATGAAAMMAIRVLLDHDVPEENIFFLTLIAATTGRYGARCCSIRRHAITIITAIHAIRVDPICA